MYVRVQEREKRGGRDGPKGQGAEFNPDSTCEEHTRGRELLARASGELIMAAADRYANEVMSPCLGPLPANCGAQTLPLMLAGGWRTQE